MKRNENLVPLSRDHHFGLLCCWKIKQGIKKGASYERIKNYINYFWQENLIKHFEIEDIILSETSNFQIQMENEHREIHKLINTINQSEDIALLATFAEALQSHIRFEERVFFPHLEEHISEKEMMKIGEKLNDIHHKEEDHYTDEFWK